MAALSFSGAALSFSVPDVSGRPFAPFDLLQQPQHVPVLPAFHKLTVDSQHDGHPGNVEGLPCRRKAQSIAGVPACAGPANTNLIARGNGVVDLNVEV